MNIKRRLFFLLIVLLMLVVVPLGAYAADTTDYVKTPILLKAKDVLQEKVLKGENYTIEDEVQNDGLINSYRVTTPYGPIEAESTEALMIRITELNAMNLMEEMDRKKVFGDSVVAGVKAPFQGAANLVKAPVETSKSIVKGTGRFLSNIGRSVVSDDPHQDNVLKVALGYDATKRVYAYEFGINPYSEYEPVLSMLGSVSQASVAGGLAPKVAMTAVGGTAMTVARVSGTAEGMRKLVRDNPPGELRKINSAKLVKAGISQTLIDALLDNYVYDPQEVTLLVGELDTMDKVKGREEFVAAAGLAKNRSVALFYRVMASMMAGYHANVSPVESIARINGTPYLKREDEIAVLLMPVDYIFRTVEVESKLSKLDAALTKAGGAKEKEFWLTGQVDAGAKEMFAASGWKIMEKSADQLYAK